MAEDQKGVNPAGNPVIRMPGGQTPYTRQDFVRELKTPQKPDTGQQPAPPAQR